MKFLGLGFLLPRGSSGHQASSNIPLVSPGNNPWNPNSPSKPTAFPQNVIGGNLILNIDRLAATTDRLVAATERLALVTERLADILEALADPKLVADLKLLQRLAE